MYFFFKECSQSMSLVVAKVVCNVIAIYIYININKIYQTVSLGIRHSRSAYQGLGPFYLVFNNTHYKITFPLKI